MEMFDISKYDLEHLSTYHLHMVRCGDGSTGLTDARPSAKVVQDVIGLGLRQASAGTLNGSDLPADVFQADEHHSFQVLYAAPSPHVSFSRLDVRLKEAAKPMESCPGYFVLRRHDRRSGQDIVADIGYAFHLSYDRRYRSYVFRGLGMKIAEWQIFCS